MPTKNIKKILEQLEVYLVKIEFTQEGNPLIKVSFETDILIKYSINSPIVITLSNGKKVFSRLSFFTYNDVLGIQSLFLFIDRKKLNEFNLIDRELKLYFIES